MFPRLLRFVLVLLAPVSILIALTVGSMSLDAAALWRVLSGADHGMAATVVFDLRLPRALSAFTVGGLLALAGTLMQAFLRNPLADPYLLGVSSGAALGAVAGLSFEVETTPEMTDSRYLLVKRTLRGVAAWFENPAYRPDTGDYMVTAEGKLVGVMVSRDKCFLLGKDDFQSRRGSPPN